MSDSLAGAPRGRRGGFWCECSCGRYRAVEYVVPSSCPMEAAFPNEDHEIREVEDDASGGR